MALLRAGRAHLPVPCTPAVRDKREGREGRLAPTQIPTFRGECGESPRRGEHTWKRRAPIDRSERSHECGAERGEAHSLVLASARDAECRWLFAL